VTDPAMKYADKLDPKHKLAIDITIDAYQLLCLVKDHLEMVNAAERQSHSIGHILDPTLYRDQISSKSFAQQMRIVRAALQFIATMDVIKKEME